MEWVKHRDSRERDESFVDALGRGRIVVIVSDVRGLDSPYEYEIDSREIVRDRFS